MERFRVNIVGLSYAVHHFDFELDNKFFQERNTGLIDNGQFTVSVDLDKRETFLEASFAIKGSTRLVCDRSLEEFDYPITLNERIIFKFGDENREISEDVMMITRGTESLELGQYIYEFIGLSIPMKKLHTRFQEENEADEIVYSSDADEKKNEEIDPRWEKLKKLNKN